MKVHLISNGKQRMNEFIEIARKVESYVSSIHVRERNRSSRELMEWIEQLLQVGVPLEKLVMNDRVDVAVALGIPTVQLGYNSLPISLVKEKFPFLRVGCSVHSLEEAIFAEGKGADYVIYGHLFPTASKPNIAPRGLDEIKEIRQQLHIPVIAIGGISLVNMSEVYRAGLEEIAVMSSVLEASNPLQVTKRYEEMGR